MGLRLRLDSVRRPGRELDGQGFDQKYCAGEKGFPFSLASEGCCPLDQLDLVD